MIFDIQGKNEMYQVRTVIVRLTTAVPIVMGKRCVWWWPNPIWRKVWEGTAKELKIVENYHPTDMITWGQEAVHEYEQHYNQWGDYYV